MPVKDPMRRRELARERQRRYRTRHRKPLVRKFRTPEERILYARMNAKRWQARNPERKREIEAAWRLKNPERAAQIAAAANKRYRERKPHVVRAIEAQRKRAKQAAPLWGEEGRIRVVYGKAREYGFEVDHIVPLNHPLVCGLHVWANLQLLDRNLNRAKRNKTWPDMPQ